MSRPIFSIVIPSYNRRALLDRALASTRRFCEHWGDAAEVVIVDDCSSDGTVDHLRERYAAEFAAGAFRLVARGVNGGVTAAKNDGARAAGGDWLIFLDSDDEFVAEAGQVIGDVVAGHPSAALIFFRCVLPGGAPVGEPTADLSIDLERMVRRGTPGECLPVARRSAFLAAPYDEDLRGFEGLAYCRLVRRFGPALLSGKVARIYHVEGDDRLSTRAALRRRACLLARGNLRLLREFGRIAGVRRGLAIALRVGYYLGLCFVARMGSA